MNTHDLIAQAMTLHRDGRLAEAERLYSEVLGKEPENVDALQLLGVVRHQQGHRESAEALYRRAIEAEPRYGKAWANLGILLQETGRQEEAVACFRMVVSIDTTSGSSWHTLGMALARLGDLGSAAQAYRNAIRHAPEHAEAYNNLGTVLARVGDRTGARHALTTALEKRPEYISPMLNLGKLSREEGDLDEAERMYRTVLSLDPQSHEAHWGLAHVLLLRGNFHEGWEEYEWRWRLDDRPVIPARPEQPWNGEPCEGKRVLVYAEQGLGDAVQFVRYASLLVQRGARVTLQVPEPLVRLFGEIPGIDAVVASVPPSATWDFHCPLLSLPRLFMTTLESIPPPMPLLRAPTNILQAWHERCKGDPAGFSVGIVWAGSATHSNDARRSLSPDLFEQLTAIEGIRLYSLQVDSGSRGTSKAPAGVIDYTSFLNDVADTAGLIAWLDLVITADTLVAHLAGAMGKPVWILLPFAPDWRWLMGRTDSPWYPTARLFRQEVEGDWVRVMHTVAQQLRSEVRSSPRSQSEPRPANDDLSRGMKLHEDGRVVDAEVCYRTVLQTDPDNREAQYLLAVSRYQQNDCRAAITIGRQLVRAHPFFAEAYSVLGNSLRKSGDLIGAEDVLRKAVALRPDDADAHYNLGGCLADAWRLDEAAEEFLSALRLNPSFTQALNNLGLMRYRQGNMGEAIQYFRAGLAQQPGLTDVHWNLAHALLHSGMYTEGWKEFEWRWRMPAFQHLASRYTRPRWNGEPLNGRRLLVWSEQGFGDTLHFARILPFLSSWGGEIIVECQPAILPLFARMNGITAVGRTTSVPEHDVQIPLLSLPALLGWSEIPPTEFPYLEPDPDAARRWENALREAGDRIRVGIVWAGSPTNPEGRFRSLSPELLAGIGEVADVFFVNLQKSDDRLAFKRTPFASAGRDWTERLTDFGETAALVRQLDLVITVDTAVAHLAGAMGRSAWVLLAAACDWRWGQDQCATPWYPSVRLYRQSKQGEWGDVVEDVRRDLTLLATQIRTPWVVRDEAEVRMRLVGYDPGSFASWNNIGVALLNTGHPREAIAPLQHAIALEPDNPRGHINLAFAQLADGQWAEGFENYEWRLKAEEGSSSLRPYVQPRWGGQPLKGKTIFIYAEQGFGDTIQFIRYAWLLAQGGARVVIEVRRELARLLQHAPGVSVVVVRGDEPPQFDYHAPLLSLPLLLRTTTGNVPARIPYLIAGHEQLLVWKSRLEAAKPGVRIGVCWSGNARYVADKDRSLTADLLCSILPAGDHILFPLAKEQTPTQRPRGVPAERWCDYTAAIDDFADTAALLAYLDIVVTVDTAVAHLAGALGKPVFMLLPFVPDWRWLSAGETTPWYPTMHLFRQTRRDSWDTPLSLAHDALDQFLRMQASRPSAATDTEDPDV